MTVTGPTRGLRRLLTVFRHQIARESDLIYEAYYDAFNADVRMER